MNTHSPLAIAFLLLTVVLPTAAYSDEMHACDPGLKPTKDGFGYRLRTIRCEGRYVFQDVASTTLTLASFVATFPESMPDDVLSIAWTPPPSGAKQVHLRARDLRRNRYYRMDAEVPADNALFAWPTDVLNGLAMSAQEIGIVGWTPYALGSKSHLVYLPLRVAPAAAPIKGYRLVIIPGRRLAQVYLSLAPVGEDGEDGEFLLDGQAVGRYNTDVPIDLSLPELPGAGLYHLEVGAELESGLTPLNIYFYHPG
jgi:hypothetical protein